MWNKLLGKLGIIFNIGIYVHRFFDGCNDLRYEFYNASSGLITWLDFAQQIIPTMRYHLSGQFQKRLAEIYKAEHIGLNEEEKSVQG